MADATTHVWWAYGAPCVGKSATAWELYAHHLDGEPRGYVDVDQVGMCFPLDDAERRAVTARATGVVVQHLARAGARTVVVSGVLDAGAHDEVADALRPADVTFCRLRADRDVLRPRLERRYRPEDVDRALAEADAWDTADTGHVVVDSAGTVEEVAGATLAAFRDAAPAPSAAAQPPRPPVDAPHAPTRAVLVCGATGVGKSTLAFGLAMQGWGDGRGFAFLDLQQIHFVDGVEPRADDGCATTAATVADLWQVYRRAGAVDLVLNGHVDSPEAVEHYRRALGATRLLVVRLRAGREHLLERVTARSRGEGPELAGDVLRGLDDTAVDAVVDAALAAQRRTDEAEVADVVLETDGHGTDALVERLTRLRDEHLPTS